MIIPIIENNKNIYFSFFKKAMRSTYTGKS